METSNDTYNIRNDIVIVNEVIFCLESLRDTNLTGRKVKG